MSPESKNENTAIREAIELLTQDGFEGMQSAIELLMNEAMKLERSEALGAAPYERTDERRGYANGFKNKTVLTRLGELHLAVPQARGIVFYPQSIERGCRSERALKCAVAEMYVNGIATRRVKEVTEALCGSEISSTQVSRISTLLDEQLEQFRNRPLGCFPFVFLDARYEKVRQGGHVIDAALLIAVGVNSAGKREVLGISSKVSEAEPHWRAFLGSLKKRGLHGVELWISDDHAGLKAARKAEFPGIPWQRCQFHFAQNAQRFATKMSMRLDIGDAVRRIFAHGKIEDARAEVSRVAEEFRRVAPKFSAWLEENTEECFAVYAYDEPLRKKLRTNNGVENLNREVRRRTRLVGIFPHEASLLRLATAVLVEIHEDWLAQSMPFINLTQRSQQENQIADVRIYRKKVA
jgi:transposase-like protein